MILVLWWLLPLAKNKKSWLCASTHCLCLVIVYDIASSFQLPITLQHITMKKVLSPLSLADGQQHHILTTIHNCHLHNHFTINQKINQNLSQPDSTGKSQGCPSKNSPTSILSQPLLHHGDPWWSPPHPTRHRQAPPQRPRHCSARCGGRFWPQRGEIISGNGNDMGMRWG